MILALLYIKRLSLSNPSFFNTLSSRELFLVAMVSRLLYVCRPTLYANGYCKHSSRYRIAGIFRGYKMAVFADHKYHSICIASIFIPTNLISHACMLQKGCLHDCVVDKCFVFPSMGYHSQDRYWDNYTPFVRHGGIANRIRSSLSGISFQFNSTCPLIRCCWVV